MACKALVRQILLRPPTQALPPQHRCAMAHTLHLQQHVETMPKRMVMAAETVCMVVAEQGLVQGGRSGYGCYCPVAVLPGPCCGRPMASSGRRQADRISGRSRNSLFWLPCSAAQPVNQPAQVWSSWLLRCVFGSGGNLVAQAFAATSLGAVIWLQAVARRHQHSSQKHLKTQY